MSGEEEKKQIIDCAYLGVPYFRTKRWQIYNLSLAPGLFFGCDINACLEIADKHDLVCAYLDYVIEAFGITGEEYRSCWRSDFDTIEWLKYTEVLDRARSWAKAGGIESGKNYFS